MIPLKESTPEVVSAFADTVPLPSGLPPEVHALLHDDLGDPDYQVNARPERTEWMHQVVQAGQAVTLVILNDRSPTAPELVMAFDSTLSGLNEAEDTIEANLPMAAQPVARGLIVRGSVRLQGVVLTFECSTAGTRSSVPGRENTLVLTLPHRLFRLQRRDSFRVPVPATLDIQVTLQAGRRHLEKLKVFDVSCGGISVLLRSPLEDVKVGTRFPQASLQLQQGRTPVVHPVEMRIKHARLAPPGLSQFLAPAPAPVAPPAARAGLPGFKDTPLHVLAGTPPRVELIQLGIEFGRMPMSLDRELSRLVNELAVTLLGRVKSS